LVARRLLVAPRVLVASPKYVQSRGAPQHLRDLVDHETVVQFTDHENDEWTFHFDGCEEVIPVRARFKCTTSLALLEAAILRLGVALLPDYLVTDAIRTEKLVRLLPKWEGPPLSIFAVYPVELRSVRRVHGFVEHLADGLS